jgi:acyl-CoA thioesterase I
MLRAVAVNLTLSLVFPSLLSAGLIANLQQGEHQTIMAIGTSLTSGGGSAVSWTVPVAAWLRSEYPGLTTFDNCGVSGSTSGPLGPNATRGEAAPGRSGLAIIDGLLVTYHPDAAFIEYAINDAVDAFDISLSQHEQNLRDLVSDIRASNGQADIILQTMNPVLGLASYARTRLKAYYEATREVAAELSLTLVDNEPNWSTLQTQNLQQFLLYIPDGVHPTSDAYQAVMMPEIRRALGEPMRPGDTDKDFKIDGVDLASLAQNWDPVGVNGPYTWTQGDFDGNGVIDGVDLAALSQGWSPMPYGGGEVPEPATLSLLAIGAMAMSRRRK